MPSGPIPIDWQREMASNSPPAEVELLVSSSSPVARQPPTAMQTDADEASGGGEGGAEDFKEFTDHELQLKIKRCRGIAGTLSVPDGGEKMRKYVYRVEKELDRRRAADLRKVDTARRQTVQPPSGDDSYAFNNGGELSLGSVVGKYHLNSHCTTPPIKSCGQVDGAAFSKELGCFIPGKHACPKKDGQRARNPANYNGRASPTVFPSKRNPVDYHPKDHTVCRNIADNKHLNMDGRKLGIKSCIKYRQNNNSVDSKGMSHKLHMDDDTFGSLTKRLDHSKHQTYKSERLSNTNKRREKNEVVFLDDEDTEPAKPVDVEMANKWDELQIYYPSRTDLETVELTYSDIKCLEPEEYLKSPVINFYIQYLKRSRPRDDLYIFNTYFYSKLEEAVSRTGEHDSQFSKLRRWWRSVDIFRTPYIILPIHGQMHWSLIIICMPAKETESGPIILHMDSLELHSSHEVFDVIGSYLEAEWSHLQNDSSYDIPFSSRIWRRLSRNIDKEKVEVPRQRNDYDCGIFMLYYIHRFIQEAPKRLTRENLCMFGRKWFNPEEASGLREHIRALLFDVFRSAPLDEGDSQSESHSDDHSEGEDKDDDTIVTIIDE